jgi:hypothetical protein
MGGLRLNNFLRALDRKLEVYNNELQVRDSCWFDRGTKSLNRQLIKVKYGLTQPWRSSSQTTVVYKWFIYGN